MGAEEESSEQWAKELVFPQRAKERRKAGGLKKRPGLKTTPSSGVRKKAHKRLPRIATGEV